jgi:hypothetical protein
MCHKIYQGNHLTFFQSTVLERLNNRYPNQNNYIKNTKNHVVYDQTNISHLISKH